MGIGRTPEQAREDQAQRDRDNLELRNQQRRENGLRPLTMDEYRERTGRPPRAAAANRQRVRDILAARDPQYAQTIERAVRDLSPRAGRSR